MRHEKKVGGGKTLTTPHTGRLFIPDVVNHSMIKSMRRCPNLVRYKYVDGLLPRVHNKPLTRGKWFHALLEAQYKGEDWLAVHKRWCRQFRNLFDEEKEMLGDLPREMLMLMRSYLWHYKFESEWEVLEVEKTIEAQLPNGVPFKGKVDMLVRDEFGLWLVDHKTHKRIPNLLNRLLDSQSPAYLWACWENDIPVDGFIWNYVKTAAPSVPVKIQNGSRFSKKLGETDYYTFASALVKSELPVDDYRHILDSLKAVRYKHGETQTSPFFQRHILERKMPSVQQAVREMMTTVRHLSTYDFTPENTERVSQPGCEWACDYKDLCVAELHGNNTRFIMRNFRRGDPLEYYERENDEREGI